jgi:hypothetical protein
MSELIPTYTFEGDIVTAVFEGRKIAQGDNFGDVEKTAVDYLDTVERERKQKEREETKKTATHITTPSGLKGEILSRVPTVWGSQVTIRFENGRISKFETHASEDDNLVYHNEHLASVTTNPVERIRTELDAPYEKDKRSLANRISKLNEIQVEAQNLIVKGASYLEETVLHRIALEAQNEQLEIKEALDHLQASDAEAFAPPATFDYGVADQADLGRAKGDNWLDVVSSEIIAESEGQDFDKLLTEEPRIFASELETGTLADAGITREMAYSHITSKTAGFSGEKVDDYRDAFVAQVELARRAELADRQDSLAKEAATEDQKETDAPDEALFI